MQEDFFGTKIDEIIDILVGFMFEKLPIIIIVVAILFLLWRIFRPSMVVAF